MKRKYYKATILENWKEFPGSAASFLRLDLGREINFSDRGGQFVALKSKGQMPRPLTLVDVEGNEITLLVEPRGDNTQTYANLKPDQTILVSGPQGSPLPFDPTGRNFVFAGGGIGAAPLMFPAKKLMQRGSRIRVALGGRDSAHLYGKKFFQRLGLPVKTITDNGESGRRGFVTQILEEMLAEDKDGAQVIACGPLPMLREAHEICMRYNVRCIVIMEAVMACSRGSCKGCAVQRVEEREGEKQFYYVCSDGPGFLSTELDWKVIAPRIRTGENRPRITKEDVDMSVTIGPLKLASPFIGASGCFEPEDIDRVDISKLGAVMAKGPTLTDRPGNKSPRVCETKFGMINSIGLAKSGIEQFLKVKLRLWLKWNIPVFANISGSTIEEYEYLARKLDNSGITGFEINISCPNVRKGGMVFGTDSHMTGRVVGVVRQATSLPLITKLTPNVTRIGDIAKAAEDGGTDMISCVNTFLGMSIDPWARRFRIGAGYGGLSGPCILEQALFKTWEVLKSVSCPVIGVGGISRGADAAQFIQIGARAVQIGTASFNNPDVFTESYDELADIIASNGFASLEEMIGTVREWEEEDNNG